jgi:hypothetical protein
LLKKHPSRCCWRPKSAIIARKSTLTLPEDCAICLSNNGKIALFANRNTPTYFVSIAGLQRICLTMLQASRGQGSPNNAGARTGIIYTPAEKLLGL